MGLQLSNIGVNTTGFVSGKELEQVSAEIFQAAKAQAKASESVDLSKVDVAKLRQADNGISLSGINANTQVSKQIAEINPANLQLSQSAIASLQALQASAAIRNVDKIVEGKLAIPAAVKNTQASGETFALTSASELIDANKMEKDKRGSNPFSFFVSAGKNEEKEETLTSIFA